MSNLLVSAAIAAAFEEARQYADVRTQSNQPLVRRLDLRQGELYAHGAQLAPSYFKTCCTAVLTAGACNLRGMTGEDGAARPPERILRVDVAALADDAPDEAPAVGDQVHIIPADDPGSAFAPRAMLEDRVLRQYATELAYVTSVKLHYVVRPVPLPVGPAALTTELSIESPHDYLLVLDLVLYLLRVYADPAGTGPAGSRDAGVALYEKEQAAALSAWERHIRDFAPIEDRFTAGAGGRTEHA